MVAPALSLSKSLEHPEETATAVEDLPPEEREAVLSLIATAPDLDPPPKPRALSLKEFLALKIPPREFLLQPWLREKDISELYGWRGSGKSWVGFGIACAVASGGRFLRWTAPAPRGVLYLDGENSARDLQERLLATSESCEGNEGELLERLRIFASDTLDTGLPNLYEPEGRSLVEENLEGVSLVILDNLSTLFRGGQENDAESWHGIQDWLMALKRRGLSVLFLHHAGKGGAQRGTSKREDILDSVIALKRPEDYDPTEGARFELHFEKSRGIHGASVQPFEARVRQETGGRAIWTTRDLESAKRDRIVALDEEGLTQAEIARELGINQSTVSRILARAKGGKRA